MAHVIIKCRVTFGKEMFNDCIKPHSICMRLVLSTQEEFSLKRAHYGHSPLHQAVGEMKPYISQIKCKTFFYLFLTAIEAGLPGERGRIVRHIDHLQL